MSITRHFFFLPEAVVEDEPDEAEEDQHVPLLDKPWTPAEPISFYSWFHEHCSLSIQCTHYLSIPEYTGSHETGKNAEISA